MSRPDSTAPLRSWLLSAAAGVLALVLNQRGVAVFGGTELLLGGWLPLLMTYTFGPWHGMVATGLALATSPLGLDHPWMLILGIMEAAWIGTAVHRLGWGRLAATAVFWLLVGLPMSALGIFQFTSIPFPRNGAAICQIVANALLMLAVALPLYQIERVRRWLRGAGSDGAGTPLERVLFQRFGAIVSLTLAVLGVFVGGRFDRTLRGIAEEALADDSRGVATRLHDHLRSHQRALSVLAGEAHVLAHPAAINLRLALIRREFPGFLTLLAADDRGIVIAAAPEQAAGALEGRDLSVADRPYFRHAMERGEPFVSGAFLGRGFGSDLIVALSVPVREGAARPVGVVEGSLDLQNLLATVAKDRGEGRSVLVLDHSGQVVASSGALARPALARLNREALAIAARASLRPTFTWTETTSVARPEVHLVARAAVPGFGWEIYLAEPLWKSQQVIAWFYLTMALAAAGALVLALALARRTARSVTRPLGALVAEVQALAHDRPMPEATAPATVSLELAQLGEAVRDAAGVLRNANRALSAALEQRHHTQQQLRQLLAHLDDKVRQRTEQLTGALQQAESASRAKSEFIASTSHELRTPLNAILGLSEILLDGTHGPISPEQAESVRGIEESGRHLLSLINDILDLAKIEAGKFELDRAEVDLDEVCEASLRLVRPGAEKKRLRLSCIRHAAQAALVADPRRLKQILVNLLGNAVKFTPDGGSVSLEVTASEAQAEILFTITDSGIGIAQDQLGRLFVPFQQLDGSFQRRHAGTGLGLVLVRRMAALHGGRVLVESEPGVGSRFTVALPSGIHGGPPSAPVLSEDRPFPVKIPAGTRVLIAEDNETNRLIYERSSVFASCRIVTAKNGVEAVEQALAMPPDLVLMDVQMPEMDGVEATRRLRADPRTANVPIIVITAAALPEDRARCLAAGATAFLTKPVNLHALAREVVEALHAASGLAT